MNAMNVDRSSSVGPSKMGTTPVCGCTAWQAGQADGAHCTCSAQRHRGMAAKKDLAGKVARLQQSGRWVLQQSRAGSNSPALELIWNWAALLGPVACPSVG